MALTAGIGVSGVLAIEVKEGGGRAVVLNLVSSQPIMAWPALQQVQHRGV
jgi:hypothetical protein